MELAKSTVTLIKVLIILAVIAVGGTLYKGDIPVSLQPDMLQGLHYLGIILVLVSVIVAAWIIIDFFLPKRDRGDSI